MKKGNSFVVVSHGEAVAKIIPVKKDTAESERKKEEFIEYLRSKPVSNVGKWSRDELYEETLDERSRVRRRDKSRGDEERSA